MRTWTIPSASDPRKRYTIEERPDTVKGGTYLYCACPAWKFAQGKGETCKHVRQVQAAEGLVADDLAQPLREYSGPRGMPGATKSADQLAAEALLAWDERKAVDARDDLCIYEFARDRTPPGRLNRTGELARCGENPHHKWHNIPGQFFHVWRNEHWRNEQGVWL